jgi:hypothetical protein
MAIDKNMFLVDSPTSGNNILYKFLSFDLVFLIIPNKHYLRQNNKKAAIY